MLKLSEIRRVHIELTTRCNARCPMCMRNYRGLDYNSGYPDTELYLADIQHIFNQQILEQLAQNRDRKSTRLNSSHIPLSRMPSSA